MPQNVLPGIKLWSRGEVGLPPLNPKVTMHNKTEFIVHHTDRPAARIDYANWVREIYNQHTITNGWDDIAYNFLVMTDRKRPSETVHIIEGRGWAGRGSHTIDHNVAGLGVAYMRNGEITYGVKRAYSWIHDTATKKFGGPKNFCHRDVYKTECPGADLKAWVKAGMPLAPSSLEEATSMINKPAVQIMWTPTGNGYYIVAADGGVFCYGDAQFQGSMGGQPLREPITSAALHPSGRGYVLLGADGGVFAFKTPYLGNAIEHIS